MAETELSDALSDGNLERVRALLDAGADVRYVRRHNYTPITDVMHGRSIVADEQLLPLLRLLIDRGADLDAESEYGESALSVASHKGRFDAVGLLLDAGADPAPLGWSALHRAVALGTVEEVHLLVEQGADLTARDRWDRTPWLLSLRVGDLAKAELLLAAGSDREARGRCGKPSLFYALNTGRAECVRWLLDRGADPNQTDEFGESALTFAAGEGDAESVRMLLAAGADIDHRELDRTAISAASTLEVARILIAAGSDINEVNGDVRRLITRLPQSEHIDCSAEDYHAAKHRVFGATNPQRMNFPFWKAMVVNGGSGYCAKARFEPDQSVGAAVWSFDRFGKSLNELPDGRVIEIAGEHEDSYDPDFCIYNDVIVHHGDGTFDIYGYPKEVFPPTDFHTATLVGDTIYVIGSLGYPGERHSGVTQVCKLDVRTLAMEHIETSGDAPGWISHHRARLTAAGIEVGGGKVWSSDGESRRYEANTNSYVLDLTTLTWSRSVPDERRGGL